MYLNLSKIKLQVQYENNVCKCALMTCVLSGHLCIFVKSECPVIPSVKPGEWCWKFRRSRGRKRPREYSLTKNEELKYHQHIVFFSSEHFLQNLSQTAKSEGTALGGITVTSDSNGKFGASQNRPLVLYFTRRTHKNSLKPTVCGNGSYKERRQVKISLRRSCIKEIHHLQSLGEIQT